MSKLRALKTDEEIAAVPLSQPVLVELPASMASFEPEGGEDDTDAGGDKQPEKIVHGIEQDDGAKRLQDDLEALKRDRDAANARADEAIRIAADREEDNRRLREGRQQDETALINNGLAAAQAERDAAQAEFERAAEAGDFKAQAAANSKISRAEARILHFESGAAEIAERQTDEPRRIETVRPDFAANVRSNQNLMQSEKDWMIRNQDHFKDPDFNKRLDAAYAGAVAQPGLVRGTAEYFDYIEVKTGLRKSDRTSGNERDTGVSAPPSRNERGSDGRPTGGKVMLSPEQRDIARSMGVSETEYARQVQAFDVARKSDPEKYR